MRIAPWTLSKPGYYFDLVVAPIVACVLLWMSGGAPEAWGFLVAGALAWLSAEYVIHRFAFHRAPLSALHNQHHARPVAYIGVPTYYTAPAFALVALFSVWLLGASRGDAFAAGLIGAYAWYIIVHDRYHHASSLGWLENMRRRHNTHHRGGHYNFGVSTPLFDILFGTYRS